MGAPPMVSAQPPPGCPPGLQYLTMVDQLLVKQKVEILEAFTGFETANKYKVFNSLAQQVYYAKEDTDCCTRQCCGPARPFDMNITDMQGQEVIHLNRPLRSELLNFTFFFCLKLTSDISQVSELLLSLLSPGAGGLQSSRDRHWQD